MTDEKQPEKAWAIADRNITSYWEARVKALKGEGDAHAEVCLDMVNKWLDYRLNHGPDDLSAKL
jgi:hypothetical protein